MIATGDALVKRIITTRRDGSVVVEETYSTPSWQGFAWLLERTAPDEYGRRDRIEETDLGPTVDAAAALAAGMERVRALRAVPS